jgi:hypothetical protein
MNQNKQTVILRRAILMIHSLQSEFSYCPFAFLDEADHLNKWLGVNSHYDSTHGDILFIRFPSSIQEQ